MITKGTHGGDRRTGIVGDLSQAIIELAQRPLGVKNCEIRALCGEKPEWIAARLDKMVGAGHLVKVAPKGGGRPTVYFHRGVDEIAHAERLARERVAREEARKAKRRKLNRVVPQKPSYLATVQTKKVELTGDVKIPEHVKVQVYESKPFGRFANTGDAPRLFRDVPLGSLA